MKEKGWIRRGVFLPALLCTALWGSAVPGVKSGYALFAIAGDDVPAKLFFAGLRFTIAGLLVLALVLLRRETPLLPKRDAWPGILALSGAQTILQYIFFYLGLGNTTGVRGSVLSATSTFFAVFAAHIAFRDDRMNLRKAMGCALGFAGVLVILSGAGLGGQGVKFTGEGFMLISALGQGLGAGLSRKITPGSGSDGPHGLAADVRRAGAAGAGAGRRRRGARCRDGRRPRVARLSGAFERDRVHGLDHAAQIPSGWESDRLYVPDPGIRLAAERDCFAGKRVHHPQFVRAAPGMRGDCDGEPQGRVKRGMRRISDSCPCAIDCTKFLHRHAGFFA